MSALRAGRPLRIVMLGDSIVNDTNNSNWDALLSRLYPKADIQVVSSVRGSTGCWYYHEDQHFQTYVKDWRPDLLMIGGISNGSREGKDGLACMREVIQKTREQVGCEIMVMSGPVGGDWRKWDESNPDQALPAQIREPTTAPFYREMEDMCGSMELEYLDMHTVWHEYLGASRRPYMWFHRDQVHANDRGKQVLARILEVFFAPKTGG